MKRFYRFGQTAVALGFATKDQLRKALAEQVSNNPSARLRPPRLIGEIFLENGWLTREQIEIVLEQIS